MTAGAHFPRGAGKDGGLLVRTVVGVTEVSYVRLDAAAAAAMLDQLAEVYADAYGQVPGEDTGVKADAFRDRATAALGARNYELVTARSGDELVGFVLGYSLRQERDWFGGLDPAPEPGFTDERGGERTVVLAEIEVRKAWQGKGIGRGLHDTFLGGRREERATLSANPVATATHALYERWGWVRVGTKPGPPGAYYREYAVFVRPLWSAEGS
ncbi:acetyltransferase (GNAT) family protein [Micromonospora sp. Llam0]|nr:acetyltransferase (GNAT) family protein [Micromonospora sp. Llam0]